ncbi:MAG: AgmX/PglI C-terminal domain-containing protein [Pseudomonadota bacterium]
MPTRKTKTLAVAAAVAVIGTAAFLQYRRDQVAANGPDSTQTPDALPSTTADDGPPRQRPRPSVRRLADPAARERILRALLATRQHRASTSTAGSRNVSQTAENRAGAEAPSERAQYVRESVRAIVPLLLECYEQSLGRAPSLAGKVVVDFTIDGEPDIGGVVSSSEIVREETSITDKSFLECVSETMFGIEIDPPESGVTIRVRYPFEFTPAEQ